MIWKPDVTVAAVIERDGKFLLVEEETDDGIRYNQPARHLECREALSDAVIRETLEETAWHFVPRSIVGIYNWRNDAQRALDDGIIAAHWLSEAEIRARAAQLRSPLVLSCIDDWLAGKRFPLDLVTHFR